MKLTTDLLDKVKVPKDLKSSQMMILRDYVSNYATKW